MKRSNPYSLRASKALPGLLFAGLAISPAALWAADRFWDGTTGSFGTSTNWNGDVAPGSGDNAIIDNGGTAQVTTGDNFTVNKLFLSGHAGTGTLSISGGSLSAAGTPHNMYIGGDDAAGGTGVATVNISGGSLVGSNGEMLFGSRGGTGNLVMTGGTLSNSNWIIFGRDAGGTGNATLGGDSVVSKTGGGNIALGVFSGTTNTVSLTDSAFMTSNNEVRVGWGNNSTATKGVLNMSGDSSLFAGGNIQIALREDGGSAGPSGEMHLAGNAAATTSNEFYVGSNAGANGTLTMTDNSVVNVANGFVIGRFNSSGTLTAGGTATANVGGFFVIGDGGSSVANVTINGSASVLTAKQVWVGLNGSTSTLTVNGGKVTGQADGNDATGAGIAFRGTSGTLNLNGGVIETPGFNKTSGTAALNLNGGLIRATGNTTTGSFFNNLADAEINVQAGGAKIDTNGHDITVAQSLAGVGGLTKQGAGSLILAGANAYTGPTIINGGVLTLGGSERIADASAVTLAGGTLNLNNFSETLAALTLGGNSTIDFGAGAGANAVAFADSSAIAWTGVLSLANFELGTDTIGFSAAGLTGDQLARIQFTIGGTLYRGVGFSGNQVQFAAVPEPATTCAAVGGLAFLACVGRVWRRWKALSA